MYLDEPVLRVANQFNATVLFVPTCDIVRIVRSARDSDFLFPGSWLWRINSLAREGHVTSAVIAHLRTYLHSFRRSGDRFLRWRGNKTEERLHGLSTGIGVACFPESTGNPTNQSPQLSPTLRRTKVIRLTSVACLTTMSEVIIKMKVSRAYSSGTDHGCAPSRDRRRARFEVSPNCGTT